MDQVITGRFLAKKDGCGSHAEWIRKKGMELVKRNILPRGWNGSISQSTVAAFINHGRWLAECPSCKGTEYVDPEEKIFFCFSCGNNWTGGAALQVSFPDRREEIEAAIMARPVEYRGGGREMERELMARAVDRARDWAPGEVLPELTGEVSDECNA